MSPDTSVKNKAKQIKKNKRERKKINVILENYAFMPNSRPFHGQEWQYFFPWVFLAAVTIWHDGARLPCIASAPIPSYRGLRQIWGASNLHRSSSWRASGWGGEETLPELPLPRRKLEVTEVSGQLHAHEKCWSFGAMLKHNIYLFIQYFHCKWLCFTTWKAEQSFLHTTNK